MPIITRATPQSPRRDLYAESAVLPPLESPNQFAALFEELCQELKPVGVLEEDQVATIARLLWRKHRLKVFRVVEQARVEMEMGETAKSIAEIDLSQFARELKAGETSAKSGHQKEQLAALHNLTLERYIEHLEMMERLDAGAERALRRLEEYQRRRMTGTFSPRAAGHRVAGWGRVRQ